MAQCHGTTVDDTLYKSPYGIQLLYIYTSVLYNVFHSACMNAARPQVSVSTFQGLRDDVMVAEVMHGVALIPGLHSPGPSYALPEMCFKNAKQATKTGKPTWGPPPRHDSQKLSRARIDEVRYVGPHHMREFMGHFSPGPQYTLPGGIGGAPGNAFKSAETLQKLTKKFAPKRTVTLSPTQLGFEPLFAPLVRQGTP